MYINREYLQKGATMGKNRLCRLLGLFLALVLMAVTVISPVSAAEAELTGSVTEEEYTGSAEDAGKEVYEEHDAFDGINVAESIADDFSENEGEEVTEDAAVIYPENNDESIAEGVTEDESFPEDTESSLSSDTENTESQDEAAGAEDTESGIVEEEVVGATLSEGLYFIESALSSAYVLGVTGGSTQANANITLCAKKGYYSQAFYVKSDGRGGYYFQNYNSGLRAAVSGSNVLQAKASTSEYQRWYAVKGSKSGYYQLRIGKSTGKVMEVAGGVISAGTNIHVNTSVASYHRQQWRFVPITGMVLAESRLADAKISTGYYTFALNASPENVLEVSGAGTDNKANIRIGGNSNGKGQVFYVKALGSGLYSLVNPHSGKAITAASSTIANGTNIYQYDYSGSSSQKWYIKKDKTTGKYVISNSKAAHIVLATQYGSRSSGANVQNVSFTGSDPQYWNISKSSEAAAYRLDSGVYAVNSALGSSLNMQIEDASVYKDAVAEIATAATKNSQRFVVTCVDKANFIYTITNENSRKNLEASGSSVVQTSPANEDAQKWVIKRSGGYYTICNRANGRNISVSGARTSSGTDLVAVNPGSSNAQKWKFKSASPAAPTARTFSIRAAGAYSYALHIKTGTFENNGNGVIYSVKLGENCQKFNLIANSDGTYYIANIKSGKVLDTYGAKTASGTNVVQYGKSSRSTQKWKFVPTGDADGSYYIVSTGGTVLSVQNGSFTNYSNVCVETKNNAKRQKFILVPTTPADGWRSTTSGKQSYYVNGAAAKSKWVLISGKYYYFDSNGYLLKSTVVDGYNVDASGARGSQTSTSSSGFKTTINGKKTLTSYLHNAFVPAGRTLYIWGGGWGGETSATNDSSKIGYQKTWQTFYNNYAKAGYDYTKYRFKYFSGLDCSGFAGWVLYNTMYTKNDQAYMVYQSTTVAPTYIKKGWATKTTTFRPGDVVSMDGHVWISLGTCSDKTILLVHSSPKGVQISGTGGQATVLAKKYMKLLAPNWPYDIRTVGSGYTSNVTIARWVVNGSGILKDPDGLQKMSAEQVMKFLFGQ